MSWFTLMKHKTLLMSFLPSVTSWSCKFNRIFNVLSLQGWMTRFPTSNLISTFRWHYNPTALLSFDENNADLKKLWKNIISIRSSVCPGKLPWIFKLFDGVMKLLFHGCTHEYFKICIWCLLKSICSEYVHQIPHSWNFRRILWSDERNIQIFRLFHFFVVDFTTNYEH